MLQAHCFKTIKYCGNRRIRRSRHWADSRRRISGRGGGGGGGDDDDDDDDDNDDDDCLA